MKWIVITILLTFLLIGCGPRATLTPDASGGYQLAFASPEDLPAQFAAVIQGEPAEVNDPRCDVFDEPPEASEVNTYTCDLGILAAGQAIEPIAVNGRRLSCEVYRLPVLRIFPCAISHQE